MYMPSTFIIQLPATGLLCPVCKSNLVAITVLSVQEFGGKLVGKDWQLTSKEGQLHGCITRCSKCDLIADFRTFVEGGSPPLVKQDESGFYIEEHIGDEVSFIRVYINMETEVGRAYTTSLRVYHATSTADLAEALASPREGIRKLAQSKLEELSKECCSTVTVLGGK